MTKQIFLFFLFNEGTPIIVAISMGQLLIYDEYFISLVKGHGEKGNKCQGEPCKVVYTEGYKHL